ncbi:hypothetical protein DPEC_G00208650 [Dallia pectoralis]|uniref:Uncharacterized protein n=1 Tax=Dallia pectoralis TaxID=75939 RepID=A0ACC2G5E8_DALPE|nr:hypothetical protein DPEC_G00208650 [Dallia pectoralis]
MKRNSPGITHEKSEISSKRASRKMIWGWLWWQSEGSPEEVEEKVQWSLVEGGGHVSSGCHLSLLRRPGLRRWHCHLLLQRCIQPPPVPALPADPVPGTSTNVGSAEPLQFSSIDMCGGRKPSQCY